jgi:hypothetical protein
VSYEYSSIFSKIKALSSAVVVSDSSDLSSIFLTFLGPFLFGDSAFSGVVKKVE